MRRLFICYFFGETMSCAIKNEKGLNGACQPIALAPVSALQKIAQGVDDGAHGLTEAEAKLASEMAALLLSLPGRGAKHWHNKGNDWVLLQAWPSGWANAQQAVKTSMAEVKKEWEVVAKARALLPKAAPALKKIGRELAELDESIPKAPAIKRMGAWTVEEAGPEAAARSAEAFAIWMGGPRELGYMDGKKRPAGAASARLFESAGAALRTAKAAGFDVRRGPAAIVRLLIEPLEVVGESRGMNAVRAELSRIESEALERSMEEASLERLREALGEAPPPEIQTIEEDSLAGAEEGYARWTVGWRENEAGFLNYDTTPGPLGGAMLHATEAQARQQGYYQTSATEDGVAKVRARPIEICERLGEPNVKELSKAIEIERDREQAEALAKVGQEALKARAEALRSGAAQPAPRRSRSL